MSLFIIDAADDTHHSSEHWEKNQIRIMLEIVILTRTLTGTEEIAASK